MRKKIRVDCHTHWVQPRHFTPEAAKSWTVGKEVSPWPETTQADYEHALQNWDASIVFGISAPQGGVHVPNEEVASFVAESPGTRIGFMAIDPAAQGALEEVKRGYHELGLRGIKLYPVLAGFEASDPALGPFYALAEQLGLPILWHMGATPVSTGRLRLSHPLLLDDVAVEFPRLRMVIAHLGHPWQRDAALVVRKNPHVYADISGLWFRPVQGYEALIIAEEWGITDKLLFGSDYPLWTPDDAVQSLRDLGSRAGVTGQSRFDDEYFGHMFDRDTLTLLGLDG
ncbi:MAG: amidohydrolase family protein [Thermomicrobiales bacterium]